MMMMIIINGFEAFSLINTCLHIEFQVKKIYENKTFFNAVRIILLVCNVH